MEYPHFELINDTNVEGKLRLAVHTYYKGSSEIKLSKLVAVIE